MNDFSRDLRRGWAQFETRRHFLKGCSMGLAGMWLASQSNGAVAATGNETVPGPHFAPRANRVIFLHMAGGPSQLELFDYKPELQQLDGQDCPESFLEGRRFAFIQGVPKMLGPQFEFEQCGESGAWVSDRLPMFRSVVDKVCFVKSMQTSQFNHGPAQLLLHTGNQNLGHASFGAWTMYGLGSENENLPGFIVLVSGGKTPSAGKSVWGSGYLPSVYQGVQCRSQGDPVLYLSNPDSISRQQRRRSLDALQRLNQQTFEETGDPEVLTRMAQYEMAFRMQTSVPDLTEISDESKATLEMYGPEVKNVGSYARNCLLARRMAERNVRFIQLFHRGWDHHSRLPQNMKAQCKDVDQPTAALLKDLDQRGLLKDTLVVMAGEFGRTVYGQGNLSGDNFGRDHHPRCFTAVLAGGGIKGGIRYGQTDEFSYNVAENGVHVRDLHATMLHLLGIDHQRLTFPFQGLEQRLTGVEEATVVKEIIK